MALLFETPRKKSFGWIVLIPFLVVLVFFMNYPEWELRYKNSKTKTVRLPQKFNTGLEKVVKGGGPVSIIHSRIFQKPFSQEARTSGVSPDELSIQFDSPVEIHGLLLSVDCWKSTRLVEFAAGINQKPAYQTHGSFNMLLHATFATNDSAGKIDEHVFYPKPFLLNPSDSINIGAWIQNISSKVDSVSPEMIVFYSWAQPPEPVWKPKKSKPVAMEEMFQEDDKERNGRN